MKSTIFIPKKCKIGFKERSDTFTGKLGYVIYHDGKVWRKENSWETWRTKFQSAEEQLNTKIRDYESIINNALRSGNFWWFGKNNKVSTREEVIAFIGPIDTYKHVCYGLSNDEGIKPVEFDNIPMGGFVLNKKAGGGSSGWNHRQTYCRIYDPRGFEFEITIPNLLYILENCNCMRGKGLEGKFIYGWDGKDLVLVPEDAPEYKQMVEYTQVKDLKVLKKDLIQGGVYLLSNGLEATYLEDNYYYDWYGLKSLTKTMWWCKHLDESSHIEIKTSMTSVKKFLRLNDNYANLMDELASNKNYKNRDVSYVEVVNLKLHNGYSWRSNENNSTYFIESGKGYKKVIVTAQYNNEYLISIGKTKEYFRNEKQLLNKYKLWEQKTTK